ncbi:probable linoleate 9S-lipoxygenase 5 isoform X2 [Prosopis cineraria]|uniref:probable linoleate 9S-lipoxygenase 5 isoform X2 n=1 Tax=Prosopis cineraria TaxID=364024 RepID=UPI00240F665A|nr:probable linoleate 9S-lipoxygenase 5 isoform X2 [Prosopis cineraria]
MLSGLLGRNKDKQIQGTVVLVKKKNTFDLTDVGVSLLDRASECLGQGVSFQLISASKFDRERGAKGKLGKPAYLEGWITKSPDLIAEKSEFKVHFEWEEEVGIPGAFMIKNKHPSEFFLVSLTLKNVPFEAEIHFPCNSWVYPTNRHEEGRIFFRNMTYLPDKTPDALRRYREEELSKLRGDGIGNRELEERDRIYDYAPYNDLNNPKKYERPILGGMSGGEIKHPYPRRGRTGRSLVKSEYESRVKFLGSNYVPRDEEFSPLKNSDFITFGFKSVTKIIKPALKSRLSQEFSSFDEVHDLYEGGFKLPKALLMTVSSFIPIQKLKEVFRIDGEEFLRFQKPQVIRDNKHKWMTDEEFAREMLAGVNPVKICRVQGWPIKSKVDGTICKINQDDIKENLEGLSVEQAIGEKRLFILDYYDDFISYLGLINKTAAEDIASKVPPRAYATRTILFLKNDGTLMPLAIELSLPREGQFNATPEVYLPAEQGVESWIWKLAKAYVVVNDSNYHQLISHWLYTHAVVEPFVIAANRQLSVLHPVYKLLAPHFVDTMKINALARQFLINANGIIESTFLPGKYSMMLSSGVYKNWVFTDQALPADLLKRGMATEDSTSPHGLDLAIKDYPYAVDGLDIWFAIKTWVQDYCFCYYESDETVQGDTELQSWWKELVQVGHGDKKDDPNWPQMKDRDDLIKSCTILMWITSGLHAAVNFGQYPYGGYILNRPTMTRRYMPQKGSPEYEELKTNPEKVFLRTINSKEQAMTVISTLAILSRHSFTEAYLGQSDISDWISDKEPLEAFERFKERLKKIEERIERDNNDVNLENRHGLVNMPYTLLYPNSEPGLSGKGIPNSISI